MRDHFFTANSACQLSTTVKGCVFVCSTGIATRNRVPSLVAFASETRLRAFETEAGGCRAGMSRRGYGYRHQRAVWRTVIQFLPVGPPPRPAPSCWETNTLGPAGESPDAEGRMNGCT